MLHIKQLTTYWEQQEYRYDFQVNQGDFIAIVGPSGGGKSTLLSLIAGLLPIYSGQIEFAGQNITQLPAYKRPVSLLFQNHNLFEHLTIAQNIALGIRADLKLSTTEKQQIASLAQELEIADLLGRKPFELSGGQQQRAAIGRILLRKQPILLLDEPFSALDEKLRAELLRLVYKIHQKNGLTTLMVSHHGDELSEVANNFITINPPK
ncbi:MAG: ATP-binding cassette domain-containing protein [Alphaproteobacteria bacterium]